MIFLNMIKTVLKKILQCYKEQQNNFLNCCTPCSKEKNVLDLNKIKPHLLLYNLTLFLKLTKPINKHIVGLVILVYNS